MSQELIDKVKRKCYIADDDELMINKITDIIEDSIPKVRRMLGISDKDYIFSTPGEERELFLNYCWYAWNDSIDSFKDNYLDDILVIRSKYEVDQYVKTEENE